MDQINVEDSTADRGPVAASHLLEASAWTHLVATADRPALAKAALTIERFGAATALRCRAGGPLMNRAFGVPHDASTVLALAAHYRTANVPLFLLQFGDPDRVRGAQVAAAASLVRYRRGFLQLVRGAGPVMRTSTAFAVGPAQAHEVLATARIFCGAFDADPVLAPVIASLHGSPRWRFVVARAHGLPVGVGILYVEGSTGYLFGGATAPRSRGMGAQSALIAARLQIAEELGCRTVGAHTGEQTSGDPQHSYHNMVRAGFQVVGRLDSYAPEGIVWNHGRRAGGAY